jgi:hypothetical protein
MDLAIPKIYVKWNYVFQIVTTTTGKKFLLIWPQGYRKNYLGEFARMI